MVDAPLFRDPIYDAASDPTVIFNHTDNLWYMFYTQRRSAKNIVGVAHIHGTDIGMASSEDGNHWLYRGTVPNLNFEFGHNTFWAPEVIFAKGEFHMYVSYIRGVPTDWNRERHIVHYTSRNIFDWKFRGILELSSDRVIDPCVHLLPSGRYKMWYKDEANGSFTYSAISNDMYYWKVVGAEITDHPHEGPDVFRFGGKAWMLVDEWNGLGVYESKNFSTWTRSGVILKKGGKREGDGTMANHASVLVCKDEAYIFYFTHPYFRNKDRHRSDFVPGENEYRTCIQAARLTVEDGKLCCNRDEDFDFHLYFDDFVLYYI